jgi:hypothetical protein
MYKFCTTVSGTRKMEHNAKLRCTLLLRSLLNMLLQTLHVVVAKLNRFQCSIFTDRS